MGADPSAHARRAAAREALRADVAAVGGWASAVRRPEVAGLLVHRLAAIAGPSLPARAACGVLRVLARVVSGTDIHHTAVIGGGLAVLHGQGLVIGEGVRVGRGCTVHQGVTLGRWDGGDVVVGDRVFLAPGAKAFGALTIGDAAVVGANAVVTADVRPGAVVAGVPARELTRPRDGAAPRS